MQSPNKPQPTVAERKHIERIKALPCSICNAPGPSECHEIEQGYWFTSMPLCFECHRGASGIHQSKASWKLRNMTELDALNITIGRLFGVAFDKPVRLSKQFKPSSKMLPRRPMFTEAA